MRCYCYRIRYLSPEVIYRMIPPERMARIILGKLGIIGCSIGAYLAYAQGDEAGYFLIFVTLAAISLVITVAEIDKGDNDDDDEPKPNLRFRH